MPETATNQISKNLKVQEIKKITSYIVYNTGFGCIKQI